MLFRIQAALEDYLGKRDLADSDGYALRLANMYFNQRSDTDTSSLLSKVRRVNT